MPTIHSIYGELGSHRYILGRLREALINKDFSLLVVFPTLSLLHHIQDELLNEPGVNGLGGVRFLLFEGFIQEVLQRLGLPQATPSALAQDLLLTEAFELLSGQGKLDYLGRAPFTPGYRQAILAGIAEWKRSCLTPALFSRWAGGKGDKEKQLALLYQTYQQLVIQNGFSEEDLILHQLEQERAGSGLPETRLSAFFYGFTDLTPLQSKFLEVLSAWFEFEIILDPTPVAEIREFIARRFSCGKLPEAPRAYGKNILYRLQGCFGTDAPTCPAPANDTSVQILQVAGFAKQATAIACEMAAILRDNAGCRLDDFLILASDPQAFLKASRPVFSEYHFQLPAPATPVAEYPGPNHFSQALAACLSDWQWPEMEVFIRQQYNGEASAMGDRILVELGERYGALSGKGRWLNVFQNKDLELYFREKSLDPGLLVRGITFLKEIPQTAPLKEYLEIARRFISTAHKEAIRSSIRGEIDYPLQTGNLKALQQLEESIGEALAYIDKTSCRGLANGPKEVVLAEFQLFWQSYLTNCEIKAVSCSGPVVRVLVPQEGRGLRAKFVFITGLEQGNFPRSFVHDWKLSIRDRRELLAYGIEMETGEQYQTKEKMAFYWGLQTAEERLYLVYQTQDSNGHPLNPSSFLDEVQQYFPDLLKEAKCYPLALEPPLSLGECFSSLEQGSFLAVQLMAASSRIPEPERTSCAEMLRKPVFKQLAKQIWQENAWRMDSEKSLFKEPQSRQLVAEIFGPDHTFAITALEDYRACPYRFFLKQLLKVKPFIRPQMLPDHFDLGNLYHQVLQEFGENFRGQSLTRDREAEYRKFLGECFRDFYREWQQNAANDLIKLVLSLMEAQIGGALQRWLQSEIQWAEDSGGRFKIRFLEFGFGLIRGDFDPGSIDQPFQMEASRSPVRIWGKVDRIDSDGEGNFIVYDYKSGRGPSSKDLLEVKYLQIPVYLMALEQLLFGAGKAAGGSYLGLKDPSRGRGGVWHRGKLQTGIFGKGLLDETEWQNWLETVQNFLAGSVHAIRSGNFFPGQDCAPFCEYQSCCRHGEREVDTGDEASAE